jgi:DNA-binding MarR family transcriptional regulator
MAAKRTRKPALDADDSSSAERPAQPSPAERGRFAYEGLQRTIHEKARLGIMVSLAAKPEGALFVDLKELCALTDGNLNRHLQVLQEAGLVEVWKGIQDRRPQTVCRLTRAGREALMEYLDVLQGVVADAAAARAAHSASQRNGAHAKTRFGWGST